MEGTIQASAAHDIYGEKSQKIAFVLYYEIGSILVNL